MEPRVLTVGGVPEHLNLPWHLGADVGFPEVDREVEWVDEPGGTGAQARRLQDGALDLATMLTDGAIAHLAEHGGGRIVGWWTSTPMWWGVHVAGRGPHRSLADLEGTTAAVSRLGSGSDLMTRVLVARESWTEDVDPLVVGGIEGAREALASRRADLFLWDRYMTEPLVRSGEFRRLDDLATPWNAFVIVASDRALAEEADVVARLVSAAFARAAELSNRDGLPELVSERYGIGRDEAADWWERTAWSSSDVRPSDGLGDVVERLVDIGVLETFVDPSDLVAEGS